LVDAYRIEFCFDDEAETQTFRGQVAFRKWCSQDDGWTENIPDSQPDPEMIHAERETLNSSTGSWVS